MHGFKSLSVRQKSRILIKEICLLTKAFPEHEKYSLSSQIQRACISIASNIAEESGRSSKKEFVQFLHIAYGSAFEVETQIILAHDLGYIRPEQIHNISYKVQEVERMIYGLIQYNRVVSRRQMFDTLYLRLHTYD